MFNLSDKLYDNLIKEMELILQNANDTFDNIIKCYNYDVNKKIKINYTIDEAINMYFNNYKEKIILTCKKYKNIDYNYIMNEFQERLENDVRIFKQLVIELNYNVVNNTMESTNINNMPKLMI